MPKTNLLLLGALGLLLYTANPAILQAAPLVPLPHRCVGVGPLPLDPDFCGCTWGAVYYRGQAIPNAAVTLRFGSASATTATQSPEPGEWPLYGTSGALLGAKLQDVMSVTVTFAGQTATRPFRAWPDKDREQEVALVLPERGAWMPWLTGGYTRTLAVAGNILWAGGPVGLLVVDLTNHVSVTHTLPWTDPTVLSVNIAPNGHVWAAGPHNLAEFDGAVWQNRAVPFATTIRALAVHPTTGAVWVGGGDSSGALAMYDGVWQPVTAVAELVTALAVDGAGAVWVGTWGGGVYRHDLTTVDINHGWQQYTVKEGLASDYILTIAAADANVWFGTRPYIDAQGIRGGVSLYTLTANTWRTYTADHGLPADPVGAAAPIYVLALDANGVPWIGTAQGVHLLATPDAWITDILTTDPIRALAVVDNVVDSVTDNVISDWVIAARANGQLLRLDQNVTPGAPPTVQITSANALTVTQSAIFTITATATDNDSDPTETGQQILAWDWRTDDQPLCTTAALCTMPGSVLTLGQHTVSLRVQDDEGVWSAPMTSRVTVVTAPVDQRVYLPVVMR